MQTTSDNQSVRQTPTYAPVNFRPKPTVQLVPTQPKPLYVSQRARLSSIAAEGKRLAAAAAAAAVAARNSPSMPPSMPRTKQTSRKIAMQDEKKRTAKRAAASSADPSKSKSSAGPSNMSDDRQQPYGLKTKLLADCVDAVHSEFRSCGQKNTADDYKWTFSLDYVEIERPSVEGPPPPSRFQVGIFVWDKDFHQGLKDASPNSLHERNRALNRERSQTGRQVDGQYARYYGCTSMR